MRPTAAPGDLAYTRALAAASQRMWAAPDVAALWRIVVDEAVALIGAEGAAVVRHTERFWQTLAAHPSDAAADDSASAALIEMLFRQGLLQQPISIDDPAEGASWDVVGRRGLLVVRIEGAPRQPVRLVWYARPPATPSRYADLAEAFAHHRQSGLQSRYRTRQPEPSGSGTASSGARPRNLDDPTSAHGRPGVHPAETPLAEQQREATNDRTNGHPDRRSAGSCGE